MKLFVLALVVLLSFLDSVRLLETNSIMDAAYEDPEREDTWSQDEFVEKKSEKKSVSKDDDAPKSAIPDLTTLVRDQLQIELRKMKSSITDSIMEELISYYGKQFASNDALKQEIDGLTKKITALTQNLNSLGQNYKSLSTSHRNLVDVVRNNLIRLKKERRLATSRRNTAGNTRALSDEESSTLMPTSTHAILTKALQLTSGGEENGPSSMSYSHLISEKVHGDLIELENSAMASSSEIDSNNRIVRHEDTHKNSLRVENSEPKKSALSGI